ncbi:ATP-grasp domain-containing protein [Brucella pseudogrignonensis]
MLLPNSANTKLTQRLIRASGLKWPKEPILYANEAHRLELLNGCVGRKRNVAIQIPLPYGDVPSSVYAVDRDLILFLNNKANLEKIIPSSLVAPRAFLSTESLTPSYIPSVGWPLAVKSGMSQPSMGGDDVSKCCDIDELSFALTQMPICGQIIIEPWLEHEKNLCIQFFLAEKSIAYLGSSEQIIESHTHHIGNIIHSCDMVDNTLIEQLKSVCMLTQNLGYRGVVGFDVLFSQGRPFVIDANYRLNGSTAALLISKEMGCFHQLLTKNQRISTDDTAELNDIIYKCEQGEMKVIAAVESQKEYIDITTINSHQPTMNN